MYLLPCKDPVEIDDIPAFVEGPHIIDPSMTVCSSKTNPAGSKIDPI